jgi:acetyl-CoA carboxylase carboxyl transferase beta subunit
VEKFDVSIEHRHAPEPDGAKPHPNTCPKCGSHYRDDELDANLRVCPHCEHHFPVRAPVRIQQLADPGSFVEEAVDLRSDDPLGFFDQRPYTERLAEAEVSTGLGEAMVIGRASIEGRACELAVMDFSFMGGSMGRVVGEKFALACESASEQGVPLVAVTASGGARMQEAVLSLMQLPKTVCAVEDLYDGGGSMLNVLAHPTTGGVLASFASLGDVMVAERVVESVTREKLPEDFGRAEPNYRFGHLDAIVPRGELKAFVSRFLRVFGNGQ